MGCSCCGHGHSHERKTWKNYVPIVVLAGILGLAAYCQEKDRKDASNKGHYNLENIFNHSEKSGLENATEVNTK